MYKAWGDQTGRPDIYKFLMSRSIKRGRTLSDGFDGCFRRDLFDAGRFGG